jgi:hypothetical protein
MTKQLLLVMAATVLANENGNERVKVGSIKVAPACVCVATVATSVLVTGAVFSALEAHRMTRPSSETITATLLCRLMHLQQPYPLMQPLVHHQQPPLMPQLVHLQQPPLVHPLMPHSL